MFVLHGLFVLQVIKSFAAMPKVLCPFKKMIQFLSLSFTQKRIGSYGTIFQN